MKKLQPEPSVRVKEKFKGIVALDSYTAHSVIFIGDSECNFRNTDRNNSFWIYQYTGRTGVIRLSNCYIILSDQLGFNVSTKSYYEYL
jgi:hypothetical protein